MQVLQAGWYHYKVSEAQNMPFFPKTILHFFNFLFKCIHVLKQSQYQVFVRGQMHPYHVKVVPEPG